MKEILVKKIGGSKYAYAAESIYLNKGVAIRKTKALGRLYPGGEATISGRLARFRSEVDDLCARERAKYWQGKLQHKKAFSYRPVLYLEKLRVCLIRLGMVLSENAKSRMVTDFVADFIYNSNKIEGSRLPRKRVDEILEQGVKGSNEVVNAIRAISFFDQAAAPFTLAKLKKGQEILLAHEKDKHGFRGEPFVVGDSPVGDHTKIKKDLQALFRWYSSNKYRLYPLELAFLFHYRFERIHPFPDGNGRMGRILMNLILKRHRFQPVVVWNSRRAAYFAAFEKAMAGRMDSFLKFMIDQYVRTCKIYLQRFGKIATTEAKQGEVALDSKSGL